MNVHESLANLYYSIILMYRYNNEPNIDPCGNPIVSEIETIIMVSELFLAPPAEWQRSFTNAESSVVVVIRRRRHPSSSVNFSLKNLISQKLLK